MPAKNAAQLRAAYAAMGRGEEWGRELVEKTPRATRSRMMKQKPAKKKAKKSTKKKK